MRMIRIMLLTLIYMLLTLVKGVLLFFIMTVF